MKRIFILSIILPATLVLLESTLNAQTRRIGSASTSVRYILCSFIDETFASIANADFPAIHVPHVSDVHYGTLKWLLYHP
jgi:hypothetical protein